MKKVLSAKDAINLIQDGASVMIAGFLDCGAPQVLVDELVNQNKQNLTMISNDTTFPHLDKGKLIVKSLKVSVTELSLNLEPSSTTVKLFIVAIFFM